MYLHTLKYVNTYIVFLPLFFVAVARCVPCCADPHLSAVWVVCAAYIVGVWMALSAIPGSMADACRIKYSVVAGLASHAQIKKKWSRPYRAHPILFKILS